MKTIRISVLSVLFLAGASTFAAPKLYNCGALKSEGGPVLEWPPTYQVSLENEEGGTLIKTNNLPPERTVQNFPLVEKPPRGFHTVTYLTGEAGIEVTVSEVAMGVPRAKRSVSIKQDGSNQWHANCVLAGKKK